MDCFSEIPTSVFGKKLQEQAEERLSFYETGEIPFKDPDVMKKALVQLQEVAKDYKLEKQKKRLSDLVSLETSSSTPEECVEGDR